MSSFAPESSMNSPTIIIVFVRPTAMILTTSRGCIMARLSTRLILCFHQNSSHFSIIASPPPFPFINGFLCSSIPLWPKIVGIVTVGRQNQAMVVGEFLETVYSLVFADKMRCQC
jgi:hypothetical protein